MPTSSRFCAIINARSQAALANCIQATVLLTGKGKELVIGPYRILERLGAGGIDTVCMDYHARTDRLVEGHCAGLADQPEGRAVAFPQGQDR